MVLPLSQEQAGHQPQPSPFVSLPFLLASMLPSPPRTTLLNTTTSHGSSCYVWQGQLHQPLAEPCTHYVSPPHRVGCAKRSGAHSHAPPGSPAPLHTLQLHSTGCAAAQALHAVHLWGPQAHPGSAHTSYLIRARPASYTERELPRAPALPQLPPEHTRERMCSHQGRGLWDAVLRAHHTAPHQPRCSLDTLLKV